MKKYFTPFFIISFLLISECGLAQWDSTFHVQNNYGRHSEIFVTSTAKAVESPNIWTNDFQCLVVPGRDFAGQSDSIAKAFANVPLTNRLKAKAGEPFEVAFEYKLYFDRGAINNINPESRIWGAYNVYNYPNSSNLNGQQGKSGEVNTYNKNVGMTLMNTSLDYDQYSYSYYIRMVFSGTYTFDVGSAQSYLVFPFTQSNSYFGNDDFTIIIPFVVEGPTEKEVDSLGVTTEPQIPYMIVHSPPGDNSSATVTNSGTKCRSFEEKVSLNESNEFYGAYKLGFKGSVGFILNLELEVYAEVSASGTQGSFQTKRKSTENCVTVSNSLTAISNGKGAQNNDLFVGYGIDLAYGFAKNLKIVNNEIVIDTSLIYRPLIETKREFFLTKTGILNDIAIQQAKVNDSLNYTIPERANAQYQINVWQQVLDKNDANIAAAALLPGENMTFSGGASQDYFSSIAYNTSQSIEVEHYIDTQIGVEVAAYFGGSGFKAGAKFTTNKTFGQIQTSTGGQSQDITVSRYDNDDNDYFTVKAVKDPVYGTPIFILDSALSKTSGPYEGGYPLDQPRLEILGTSDLDTTISNISLGTSGNFRVKACNDSKEPRNYDFGFVGESIATDLILTSAASEGTQVPNTSITKFKTITAVPIGGCKTETFDINASRRNSGSEMDYQNIEFQLYGEEDTARKSSIMASLSWAGPPPPTGVAASLTELCTSVPITLSGNCPPITTARWYTTAVGGFPFGEGASVIVTPSANVTYYIGCETANYARDRVATQPVLFANNSPTLNLTSDFSSNSLQIANTNLTATNKIIDPARVTYKAGNSLTFNPGFEVKSGSAFKAEIGGCVN